MPTIDEWHHQGKEDRILDEFWRLNQEIVAKATSSISLSQLCFADYLRVSSSTNSPLIYCQLSEILVNDTSNPHDLVHGLSEENEAFSIFGTLQDIMLGRPYVLGQPPELELPRVPWALVTIEDPQTPYLWMRLSKTTFFNLHHLLTNEFFPVSFIAKSYAIWQCVMP